MLESDPRWRKICDEYDVADAEFRRRFDALRYRKTAVETNVSAWPSVGDLTKIEAAYYVRHNLYEGLWTYLNSRGHKAP